MHILRTPYLIGSVIIGSSPSAVDAAPSMLTEGAA